jgi:Asp-tRNA(Asn)/Glu-tRNA(Gln) amidotransferase A subunit family amidase
MLSTLCLCLALALQTPQESKPLPLDSGEVHTAGRVAGLDFTEAELALMLRGVCDHLAAFEGLNQVPLENSVAPVVAFTPLVPGIALRKETLAAVPRLLPVVDRPSQLEDLAFADIPTLASLIRTRKVSCAELTEMYLARLERLDPQLLCVVTLCKERARAQAKALDEELAAGHWRGPLHGIPWGAKDLIATKGIRTTWGSKIFAEQVPTEDAEVVQRLDRAGAVLIAKLSLGELAWGDVWFGGTTKNPWNPAEGSSGSSAGPASATAAGCVAFAIGSETCGSIVSPSARCGCSALRPTFGRVSRRGAMALAWSMDKLGPLCRSAGDAALVFAAIQGRDPLDESTVEQPFADLGPVAVKGLKAGYVPGSWRNEAREKEVLDSLRAIGLEPVAIELPHYPLESLMMVLSAEAATAFDELTRSGRDEAMVRQVEQAWPNVFRQARLIPAVEYLRANRVRRLLMLDLDRVLAHVDVAVHPSTGDEWLEMLNLTGQPTVCVPAGKTENGRLRSLSFTGHLYEEARLLAVAEAWQRSTGFHLEHPSLH